MQTIRKFAVVLPLVVVAVFAIQSSTACPFCQGGSALTLSEQIAASDAVVLVQWVSAKQADEQTNGSTTYKIVEAVKQPDRNARDRKQRADQAPQDAGDRLLAPAIDAQAVGSKAETSNDEPVAIRKGGRLTLDRHRSGKAGDLFLVMGTLPDAGNAIEWGNPEEVTEAGFQYVVQAPSPETDPLRRLRYFVKFLEFPDDLVSGDAYREFARAPYEQITPLAKDLPRDKIRRWLVDPQTPQIRLGLYGLLLGLCGNSEDAGLMAEKINARDSSGDIRLGIDGVIAGYLLLTNGKGLDLIDESILRNREAPVSEMFAAMTAIRFMWSYAEGVVEKERIRASMRLVLDRPELAEFAIPDLARWEDWTVQDRLANLFGTGEYDVPAVKSAIVGYMLASTRHKSKDNEPVPDRVTRGKQHLQTLREKDPQTVKTAERFAN